MTCSNEPPANRKGERQGRRYDPNSPVGSPQMARRRACERHAMTATGPRTTDGGPTFDASTVHTWRRSQTDRSGRSSRLPLISFLSWGGLRPSGTLRVSVWGLTAVTLRSFERRGSTELECRLAGYSEARSDQGVVAVGVDEDRDKGESERSAWVHRARRDLRRAERRRRRQAHAAGRSHCFGGCDRRWRQLLRGGRNRHFRLI